jgi:hypothetical protein
VLLPELITQSQLVLAALSLLAAVRITAIKVTTLFSQQLRLLAAVMAQK